MTCGNPARVLRKRFDDELIDLMLRFKWWDRSIEEIGALIPILTSSDLDIGKGSEYTVKYYEGVVTDVTAGGVKELTSRDKLTLGESEMSKTVTVAVTAKGKNYEGTALGTYEVVKPATGTLDLSKAKIVAAGKDAKGRDVKPGKQEYTGDLISPVSPLQLSNAQFIIKEDNESQTKTI